MGNHIIKLMLLKERFDTDFITFKSQLDERILKYGKDNIKKDVLKNLFRMSEEQVNLFYSEGIIDNRDVIEYLKEELDMSNYNDKFYAENILEEVILERVDENELTFLYKETHLNKGAFWELLKNKIEDLTYD